MTTKIVKPQEIVTKDYLQEIIVNFMYPDFGIQTVT